MSDLPLRERKKLRTARDLQAAALALFAEHGFDHVTTDDIAAAAEVSKTTFYRYFTSKDEVLLGSPETDLALLRAALDERPPDEPPLDSVRNAILGLADTIEHDRDTALAKLHLTRTTSSLKARRLEQLSAVEQVVAGFLAGRRGLDPQQDLAARVLAAHTVTALRVAVEVWLDHDGEPELLDLVRRALAMMAEDPRSG